MRKVYLYVLTLICLLAAVVLARIERPNLRAKLKYGTNHVGFKIVQKYDKSRTFGPSIDFFGKQTGNPIYRPIQISIWYPAERHSGESMQYKDYIATRATEVDFSADANEKQQSIAAYISEAGRSSKEYIENILSMRMLATRDAKPLKGKHATLIYASSHEYTPTENTVLFEYLASHGFVVISCPSMGFRQRENTVDIAGLDANVRDTEFVIAFAETLDYTDMSKFGLFGFSYGGLSSTINAMIHDRAAALVTLDGTGADNSEIAEGMRHYYLYDSRKLRIPYLAFKNGRPDNDDPLMESGLYAPCAQISLKHLDHGDFSSDFIYLYYGYEGERRERTGKQIDDSYAYICTTIKHFFTATLVGNNDGDSVYSDLELNSPPELAIFQHKKAFPAPPGEQEFLELIASGDVEKAKAMYKEFTARDPDLRLFSENSLLGAGIRLPLDKRLKLIAFSISIFGESVFAFNHLGAAHRNSGHVDQAEKYFAKAYSIAPGNMMARMSLTRARTEKMMSLLETQGIDKAIAWAESVRARDTKTIVFDKDKIADYARKIIANGDTTGGEKLLSLCKRIHPDNN